MLIKLRTQVARILKVEMPLKFLALITKIQLRYNSKHLEYFPLLRENPDLIPLATAYPDERMENYRIRGTNLVIYPSNPLHFSGESKRYSIVEVCIEKCFDYKGHFSFQEVARKVTIDDILEKYPEEQQRFFLFNLNYFR